MTNLTKNVRVRIEPELYEELLQFCLGHRYVSKFIRQAIKHWLVIEKEELRKREEAYKLEREAYERSKTL